MKLSEVTTTNDIQVYLEERIEAAREKFGTGVFNPVHNRTQNDREKSFTEIRNYILQGLIEEGKYNTEVSRRTCKLTNEDFPHISNSDAEDVGIWIRMLRKKGILGTVKAVNRLSKFMMVREDGKWCDEFYNVQGQLKMFSNVRKFTNDLFINQFALDFKRIMTAGARLRIGRDRQSSGAILTSASNTINHSGYPEVYITESTDKRDIIITVRCRKRQGRCRRFARAIDHLNFALHEMSVVEDKHWTINSPTNASVVVRLVNQEPQVEQNKVELETAVLDYKRRHEAARKMPATIEEALYPSTANPLDVALAEIEKQLEVVLEDQKKVEAEYTDVATRRSNLTRSFNVLTLSRDQLKNAINQMAK